MGHWKRLIKIPGGTDCYYCITFMTYLIHVYYCLVVLVTVPDHLFAIMLHEYVVPLPGTCYTFCGGILCILCIASIMFYVYLADIITVYAQHSIGVILHMLTCIFILLMPTCMFILHMPTCMVTAITSPLDDSTYDINRTRLRHDQMITG